MQGRNKNNQQGFIATTVVLVLSSVLLALSVTLAFLSIGEAESGLAFWHGEDTLAFVEGCAEDVLLLSRENSMYTGGTITHPEGTCQVSITKSGNIWTAIVTTASTDYTRTIQLIYTVNGHTISLSSWQEV